MSNYGSVNPELVGLALDNVQKHARAQEKEAFVAAGDPAMMGGDPAAMGGAPPAGGPPMDPAMAGGAPPMDPAMMDPAMAGGAPPADPLAGLQPMIQQAVQAAMGGMGGEGQIKPKIDVNVEIMQIKKILAKISDALGIQIPAADMVATPEDLTAMASGGPGAGAMEGSGGASAISPISGIEPMGAAMPAGPEKAGAWENGRAVDVHQDVVLEHQSTADKAAALWQVMAATQNAS